MVCKLSYTGCMSPDKPTLTEPIVSKYAILHERGVVLEEDAINLVVSAIEQGVNEVKAFMGLEDDEWCTFISSENGHNPGYVPDEREAINLPIAWLNQLQNIDLKSQKVVVWSIPESDQQLEMTFDHWFTVMGREEAVHHYQHKEIGSLCRLGKSSSPETSNEEAGTRWEPHEVEARKIVDEISVNLGEDPVWRVFDANRRLIEKA